MLRTQISHQQVKRLSEKEVVKIYKRYEAYIGGKTNESLIKNFLRVFSKTNATFVKVDDKEALQEYFVLSSELWSFAGNIAVRCGCLVVLANAIFITGKHIVFEKEPEKEPVQNLAKKLGTCKNFHLIIYMAQKSDAPMEASEVPETKPAKKHRQVGVL